MGEHDDVMASLAEDLGLSSADEATTSEEETPPESAETVGDSLKGIRDFFADIVPPLEIKIRGAYGGEYKVPAMLPGLAEIVIMQELKALSKEGVEIHDPRGGGFQGLLGSALELATNERFVAAVERCFKVAYPDILEREMARARERGRDPDGVLAVFSVAEAMKVFFPFFAALLGTGTEIMSWFIRDEK